KEQFIRSIETRLFNKSLKPVRIGVLGMLYPIKSPIEIVQAIKFLINDGFNVELVFAGDGPLKNEILNIAIHYSITDRVHCLGSITNVKAFLDDVDLFIQFSKTEGVPRALLEAMSRGCLVISSNVGGVPEFLHSDFLVESQDIRGLYNKIKALLLDKHLMFNNLDNNYNISKLNTVS